MSEQKTMDKKLNGLGHFYGGGSLYRDFTGFVYSEGVKYIMENGYAWFCSDMLAVMRFPPNFKVNPEYLYIIKLDVNIEKKTAKATIIDENDDVIYEQFYNYTDAETDSIKLCFQNNTLCTLGER